MKRAFASAAVMALVAAPLTGCSNASQGLVLDGPQVVEGALIADSALLGTWDVSLYFSPDAPPSKTQMVVTAVGEDSTLAGTFYDSPFLNGRYTTFDDEIRFTVVTTDRTGPYLTSGVLGADGTMAGQTLATGREFLMAWSAEKG
ncbi:MAG: hypothetical protein AAFP97_03190 [Pseudomonadota bacterium]